jgi:putative redox protein
MRTASVRTANGKFGQIIQIGPHQLVADEPFESEGDDVGPNPFDFLLAALGSCTSMTISAYARFKNIPLTRVEVELSQENKDSVHTFYRVIHLYGDLTDAQRIRLLEIANKCPVHRTLTGKIAIESVLAPPV